VTNQPNGLQNRLSVIEERLNQIERHLVELGADEPQAQPLIVEPEPEPSVPATQVLVSPDDQSGSDLQDEPVVAASVEETPRKEPPVVSDAASLVDETFVEETSESVQVAFLHESEKTVIVDQFAKNKPAATTPLELIVGGKWMAWIGSAAVVASVVFFLKLAYDQGWWDSVSPVSRCLMAGAFGVAMIGGGEFCLRKISKAASVGLFGAGLSVLYLVAWAASARYQVVSIEASFLLMAVVAVGGFAVTFRSRFLTIGVLSLVGGYAAPMLLNGLAGHHAAGLPDNTACNRSCSGGGKALRVSGVAVYCAWNAQYPRVFLACQQRRDALDNRHRFHNRVVVDGHGGVHARGFTGTKRHLECCCHAAFDYCVHHCGRMASQRL